MSMRTKNYANRERIRQRAANAFVQASSQLLTFPYPKTENIAQALMQAALGLHLVAKLDDDLRGLDMAEDALRRRAAADIGVQSP